MERSSAVRCVLAFALCTSFFAASAQAATIVVTTTADAGAGSLREAIVTANADAAPDTIVFQIAGSGVHTITPASPLPALVQPVVIDGTTQPGYVTGGRPSIELDGVASGGAFGLEIRGHGAEIRGLAIYRFSTGILFQPTSSAGVVQACYVGTNAAGDYNLGNTFTGIALTGTGHRVGGTTAAARNVISFNAGSGLTLNGSNHVVSGNDIGVNTTGLADHGIPGSKNGMFGVDVEGGSGHVIGGVESGAGNRIEVNWLDGVRVQSSPTHASAAILGNIMGNYGQGIDIEPVQGPNPNDAGDTDAGPNGGQNFPVLVPPVHGDRFVDGILDSLPSTTFRIELFLLDGIDPTSYGEADSFAGALNVTTDAGGHAGFRFTPVDLSPAWWVSATATRLDSAGRPIETSEFSFSAFIRRRVTVESTGTLEGSSGIREVFVPIRLSGLTPVPVVITYSTADGTATAADGDYTPQSGTVTVPAYQQGTAVYIPIHGDTRIEPNETFTLHLTSAGENGVIETGVATITIWADDAALQIPTLSAWNIALLAAALAAIGFFALRE